MGPQTLSPNRLQLKKAVGLSIVAHLFLMSPLLFSLHGDSIEKAVGSEGGEVIYVLFPSFVRRGKGEVEAHLASTPPLPSPYKGEGGTSIEVGEGGTSQLLQQIRNKIERNKFYPLIAKRAHIEGSPLIEFKIRRDGGVEYIILKNSCGSSTLDEAALKTVQQAAPFPFYPDPIALNIHYHLND